MFEEQLKALALLFEKAACDFRCDMLFYYIAENEELIKENERLMEERQKLLEYVDQIDSLIDELSGCYDDEK